MSRFFYFAEQRRGTPANPRVWARLPEGLVLFELVDGPLTEDEARKASGLSAGVCAGAMAALRQTLPVFTERELEMLLAVCDPLARHILRDVTQPHFEECRRRAKELEKRGRCRGIPTSATRRCSR